MVPESSSTPSSRERTPLSKTGFGKNPKGKLGKITVGASNCCVAGLVGEG